MTIDDIKKLIASDESNTLELKKTTGELKDGMHLVCAFLNSDGGWLIFGLTPNSLNEQPNKIPSHRNCYKVKVCLKTPAFTS